MNADKDTSPNEAALPRHLNVELGSIAVHRTIPPKALKLRFKRAISTVFALIDWVEAEMKAIVGLVAKIAAGSRGPCVAVPADNAVGVMPTVLS